MEIQDNYIRDVHSIVEIHDGDTMKALVELGYNVLGRIVFRFKGINTAEVGKKQNETRTKLAQDALAYVQDKLEKHRVRVHSEKFEDGGFGRFLGTLFYLDNGKWINLNEELFKKGLAQRYYLGASKDFGEWHE